MASGGQPSRGNPMVPVFRHLCQTYLKSGYIPDSDMAFAKFHLPYGCDDTEVTLEDYYGNIFSKLIVQLPKTISYRRSLSSSQQTEQKISTIVRTCLQTLHAKSIEEHGCIELDFVQTVLVGKNRLLSDVYPSACCKLSVADVEKMTDPEVSKLQAHQLRMCLPEGEQVLLDILEGLGAIVRERKDRHGKVICECFRKGFQMSKKSFGGSLDLDPTDLSFASWCVSRSVPEVHILLNPGPESEGSAHSKHGDVRLKSLVRIKKKRRDLIGAVDMTSQECPGALTQANVRGLLRRDPDGDGFRVPPHCGINEVTETFNRVGYRVEMDGFKFLLNVCDGVRYRIDRRIGRSLIELKLVRWPKIKFPIPPLDSCDESKYIGMITAIVQAFIDAVGDGRITPKVWETYSLDGKEAISTVKLQEIRRRIENAETLEEALDVPVDSSEAHLSETVDKLLNDVQQRVVILPKPLIEKVMNMAKDRTIR